MPIRLEQPILNDGVQFVHFFEGRILSGRDLRDEQQADRRQRRRLGRNVGSGVAEGLEVRLDSPGGPGISPVVEVAPGWALNREGEPVGLCAAQKVELVRTLDAPDGSQAIFKACADAPPGAQIPNGIGFYVFTLGTASGFEGDAPKSGLGDDGIGSGCGKRYSTLGVSFRLVKLDPMSLTAVSAAMKSEIAALSTVGTAAGRSLLRNLLAHVCLGTPQTRGFPADPSLLELTGESAFEEYGALDDLRTAGMLTDCEVPLALLSWTATGVSFLDMWAVRRRVARRSLDDDWPLLAADRRRAEAEAASFQFQSHLAELIGPNSTSIKARDYFRYVPAAGVVMLFAGGHQGFNASNFFQGLDVSLPHQIEGGRLTPLLDASLSHRPIDLSAAPVQTPLLWRYTVRENTSAPSSVQRYEVFATGFLPYQGDPLFELKMTAKCEAIEEAIEELQQALANQSTGTLRVLVRDNTGAVLAGVNVIAEHAATGAHRASVTNEAGLAQFAEAASGSWRARVTIAGFRAASGTGIVPPNGTVTITVSLLPVTGGAFGGLVGQLVDDSGVVLAGVPVMVEEIATHKVWTLYTGEDGSYAIDKLPPGDFRVTARPPNVDPIEVDAVKVAEGGVRFVSLGSRG